MATNKRPEGHRHPDWQGFARQVGAKERRKMKARSEKDRSVWFWAGMFGLVGWSVAIPTAAGIYVGVKLEEHYPLEGVSWTLTCIILGSIAGSINAWFWVKRESGLGGGR